MAFDNDYVNLDEFLRSGVSTTPLNASGVRAKLVDLLRTLGVGSNRRGGTIYIPRLTDGQLWIDVSTPLHIPREITLAVAPGVVIVPVVMGALARDGSNHLEIEGVLDARAATIFATPGWFARHPREGSERYNVGTVRLSSPHLERVYPEWWGAADASDPGRPSDHGAILAALHAAVRDRVRGATEQLPLRPLPVEFRGTYTLHRTLQITAQDMGLDQGLTLLGAQGAPDSPTFRCSESFPTRDPMMAIQGMKAITFEDIRFDGSSVAATCLRITDLPGNADQSVLDRTVPADRAHLLRRCDFRGTRGPLVSYSITSTVGDRELQVEGLQVEHCTFRPRSNPSDPGTALQLSGPQSTSVEVRGCTFRGEASAMIHASTCSLSVASCHFHNALMPLQRTDIASTDALHDSGPSGGVDLYLDALDGNNVAALYAQDCRSTSPQFLVTRAGMTRSEGNVTVVGLHYSRGPEVTLRREPIYTREDRPRWFWDVFEMTPVTFQPRSDSKFEAPPKITAQKLPVSGANDPSGLPTKLLPGTSADAIPDKRGFPKGGFPKYPGSFASVGVTFAPILWRLPAEGGGRLILMGCRFDFLPSDASVCVRGTPGASAIIDLGVLRSDGQIHQVSVDSDAHHVEVPTWPHRM